MARRAHDLRRALDVNANGTRMHNRAIVYAIVQSCVLYARARTWRRIADVSGAAAGMRIMRRICGCGWGMSLLWRAVQVGLLAWRKGVCAYAWVRYRCRYGV